MIQTFREDTAEGLKNPTLGSEEVTVEMLTGK
jgi:hypothetical protein